MADEKEEAAAASVVTHYYKNNGQCACGAVQWEFETSSSKPIKSFYNCFCTMCQKVHGTPFASYIFIPKDQYKLICGKEKILEYKSSDIMKRSSCNDCGSTVPWNPDDQPTVSIPAGCHKGENGSIRTVDCNIFVKNAPSWFLPLTDSLEQHDEYPEDAGLSSVPDKPIKKPTDKEDTTNSIHGSCLCGANKFKITTPISACFLCHCQRCRRIRAAAHACNGFTAPNGLVFIKGGSEKEIKSIIIQDNDENKKQALVKFCNTCSSPMPFVIKDRVTLIPLGTLDDDPKLDKPISHIYTNYKVNWYDSKDNRPSFGEGPPM